MNTAKLPAELRAETPRPLSELTVGETGYVALRALIVTPEQDCFLDPRGALENPGLLQMKVRRDADGVPRCPSGGASLHGRTDRERHGHFADCVGCNF